MLEWFKRLFNNSKVEYNEILTNRVNELERLNESLISENKTLKEWLEREKFRADNLQDIFFKRFGLVQETHTKPDFSEMKSIPRKRHIREVIAEMQEKHKVKRTPEEDARELVWREKLVKQEQSEKVS